MFKVFIIDDDAQNLARAINSQIECEIKTGQLKDVNRFNEGRIKDRIIKYWNCDLVVFDGSLVESNLDSVTVMEQLIRYNPEARDKIVILIGQDFIDYVKPENYEAYSKIQRSKQLPYKIHGGENNTKVDVIIKLIKSHAKMKKIEVEDRLPKGIMSDEMLNLLDELITNFSFAQKSLRTSYEIQQKLKKLEVTVDVERKTHNLIESDYFDILSVIHHLSNCIELMRFKKYDNDIIKERQEKSPEDQPKSLTLINQKKKK